MIDDRYNNPYFNVCIVPCDRVTAAHEVYMPVQPLPVVTKDETIIIIDSKINVLKIKDLVSSLHSMGNMKVTIIIEESA